MQGFQGIGRKHSSHVLDVLALKELIDRIRLGILVRHGFEIIVFVFKSAVNLVDGVLRGSSLEPGKCSDQCKTRDEKHDGQKGSQSQGRKQDDLFANRHSSGATRLTSRVERA